MQEGAPSTEQSEAAPAASWMPAAPAPAPSAPAVPSTPATAAPGTSVGLLESFEALLDLKLQQHLTGIQQRLDKMEEQNNQLRRRLAAEAETGHNGRTQHGGDVEMLRRRSIIATSRPSSSSEAANSAPTAALTSKIKELADDEARRRSEQIQIQQLDERAIIRAGVAQEIFGGNQEDEAKEKELLELRHQEDMRNATRRCLILPTSNFRFYWDFSCLVLIVFVSISLPYRTAFVQQWSLSWEVLDFVIDLFFIADIGINLRTMVRDASGQLVTSPCQILKHYARTWLVPDVVASFPLNWFADGFRFEPPPENSSSASDAQLVMLLRTFKLVKLLRLLRIARFFRYLGRWEQYITHINSNMMRLLKLVVGLIFFSHWNGCIQFFIATLDTHLMETDGANGTYVWVIDPQVWIIRAGIYDLPAGLRWSWSFYHAMTQLLAISVGVVEPERPVELWAFLISIVIGAGLYAVFVSLLTAVLTEMNASGKEYRSKIDMLHQYMRNLRMPQELRKKLLSYFELCYPDRQMFHESEILDQLSHPLQSKIALLKCRDVLTALRVLHDDRLASTIALYLERVVYVDEDYIIRAGDFGRGMYFITAGAVEVYVKGTLQTTLGKRAFFGEMALLDPDGRATADAFVRGFCEGYFMSRSNFEMILDLFPGFRQYIEMVARMRIDSRMQDGANGAVDDAEGPAAVKRRQMRAAAGLRANRGAKRGSVVTMISAFIPGSRTDSPSPPAGGGGGGSFSKATGSFRSSPSPPQSQPADQRTLEA